MYYPAPGDSPDQVKSSALLYCCHVIHPHKQVVRNKELTSLVFRNMDPPKYGTAMLDPGLCGKWKVGFPVLKVVIRRRLIGMSSLFLGSP